MYGQRILSGILMGLATLAAVFFLPAEFGAAVIAALSWIGLWEFYGMLDAAKIPHFKYFGLFGGLLLLGATWFSLARVPGPLSDAPSFVLFALVVTVFLRQFPQKNNPRPIETIAATLMGVMYVPFLMSFFVKLLLIGGDFWTGRLLILYAIFIVKFTDMGAFFVGCSIGRHKLLPRVSPAKTWEGVLGGVAAGELVSLAFVLVCGEHLGAVRVPLADAAILGLVLPVLGILGDLTESLFKRAAGVKDSGRTIRGMGGFLDVADSLLFTIPMLYVYVRLFLDGV